MSRTAYWIAHPTSTWVTGTLTGEHVRLHKLSNGITDADFFGDEPFVATIGSDTITESIAASPATENIEYTVAWVIYDTEANPQYSNVEIGAFSTLSNTITASYIESSSLIYAPSLSLGSVSLTAPLIDSTFTLNAPSLSLGAVSLTTPLLDSTFTLNAPSLSLGAVSLTTPLLDSTFQIFASIVTIQGAINVPFIETTSSIYSPTITGEQFVNPNLLQSTFSVFSPNLGLNLIAAKLDSAFTSFEPTLDATNSITSAFIDSVFQVFNADVIPGAITVSTPILPSSEAFYVPNLSVEAGSLSAAYIGTSGAVYAPSLSGGATAVLTTLDIERIVDALMLRMNLDIIPVNVKKMNDAFVQGDGTINNKWRG